MKTFRLITAGFFFAAVFAVSTFAQTAAAGKIAVINTLAFDVDKVGITKYVTASNTLDNEFKPVQTELQTMATKLQALQTEIQNLQKTAAASTSGVPVGLTNLQAKATQYEEMGRQFKFKQEDAKAKYDNRRGVVLGPVLQDIGKAMQEFAKQKGYMMILDGAKLDESGLILAIGDDKVDVTKEFITFYNARPAGTASTATPR